MQSSRITDKEILYSMIEREVGNALRGVPIFAPFGGTINSFIIRMIDPYVSAFVGADEELDSEQLGAFASEEAIDKINEFKTRYEKRKEEAKYENKGNF